jgi:ParB family chromosome partitioning protein
MPAPTTTRGSFAAMYEASRTASLDAAPRQISVEQLEPNPDQPRTTFHAETLDELAASIKLHGILQPLLVRPHPSGAPNRYQIVAGERRWQACKRAGVGMVPVVIKSLDDARCREVALIENVQREDIAPLEEAQALETILRETNMTHRELGERIGKTKAYVEQRVRLLRYPEEVQQALAAEGPFTPGHAKAVVQVEHHRPALIQAIEAQNLSVREAERRAHQLRDLEQAALPSDRAGKLADQILRPQGLTAEAYQAALTPSTRAKKAPEGQVDLEAARASGNWLLDASELRTLLKQDLNR